MNSKATLNRPKQVPSCASCAKQGRGPFCGLPSDSLTGLDRAKSFGTYPRGQILFQAGSKATGVHCLNAGLVKLTRVGLGGKEQILRLAGPGDLLGHRAVLGERPHDHDAEAMTDVEVCYLPADVISPLVSSAPPLLRSLVKKLVEETSEVEGRLVERAQQRAEERLASFLLRLCGPGDGTARVELPLSRQELADYLGAAPETIIRALAHLAKRKLIRLDGRFVEVPDRSKLTDATDSSAA
ncbi:MAG: Crp/Fnr family transcriptional regulator [Elusimicrobia bacterium]|nr:Crp/Fnr family transcriptional regulator [Elusimicrobiota bacterium]